MNKAKNEGYTLLFGFIFCQYFVINTTTQTLKLNDNEKCNFHRTHFY